MTPTPDVWYFPTAYGDIRLERLADFRTRLIYSQLTIPEQRVMTQLRTASMAGRCDWATQEDWDEVQNQDFETGDPQERAIQLAVPIADVGRFLRRRLRPDRAASLSVVRIGQGKIQEMYESAHEESDDSVTAATTWRPVLGCPAPSFDSIRRRATRVLRAFLTPSQVDEFEAYQRFETVGADTGHRYMLTSRNAPDELRRFGNRSVFDLDERRAYCVHDWDIPAEEELLTLLCLLSLPGHEIWARSMPDVGEPGASTPHQSPLSCKA